ncbi:hypothetical protein ABK040_008169 [Willaertia magna]
MNTEQQQNNAESQNNTMLSTQEGLNITFTNENPMQEEQIQEETDAMEEVQPVKGKSKRKEKKSKPYNPSSATNVRKHRKNITFHDIAACFDMPIRDASQLLGISLTQLKRLCREFQIPRWPYRRLNSIQRRIEVLQIMQQRCESKSDMKAVQQTRAEIEKLQKEVLELKSNPTPLLLSTDVNLNEGSTGSSDGVVAQSNMQSGPMSTLLMNTNINNQQKHNDITVQNSNGIYLKQEPQQIASSNQSVNHIQPHIIINNTLPISQQQQIHGLMDTNQGNLESQKIVLRFNPNNQLPPMGTLMNNNIQLSPTNSSTTQQKYTFQNYIPPNNQQQRMMNVIPNNGNYYSQSPRNNQQRVNQNFQQTEFHDYSYHFNNNNRNDNNNSKMYNFHNISFQGNNHVGSSMNIQNNVNHQIPTSNIVENVNVENNNSQRLLNRRNAVDQLSEMEKLQLLSMLVQQYQNASQNQQTVPNNNNNEEAPEIKRRNSIVEAINSRKLSLPTGFNPQGVLRKLSIGEGDHPEQVLEGNNLDSLIDLSEEDLMKLINQIPHQQ